MLAPAVASAQYVSPYPPRDYAVPHTRSRRIRSLLIPGRGLCHRSIRSPTKRPKRFTYRRRMEVLLPVLLQAVGAATMCQDTPEQTVPTSLAIIATGGNVLRLFIAVELPMLRRMVQHWMKQL
jgi:hypothetical protein